MTKFITITTGLLTLALAIISFVLSFNALSDLAAQHGVSIPPLFPFVVEAGVIVFSVALLYWSLHGERTRWLWTLIIMSSALAGTFNIVHAQPDIVSRSMAAMPSLFLLLSFETFLSLVKHRAGLNTVVQSLAELTTTLNTKRSEVDAQLSKIQTRFKAVIERERLAFQAERDHLTMEAERLRVETKRLQVQMERLAERQNSVQDDKLAEMNAKRTDDKQVAMNTLVEFYRSNPLASLSEAGQEIGRSKATVSNYLNELEEAGTVHRNGQGVEVLNR